MNGNGRDNGKLTFGVFDVDAAAGELRNRGTRVKIQQQPFKLLLLLLERPGEVVTREELKQKLAPDQSFGDFDHTINAAVAKLRHALGDSRNHPRYIETLPRHGYRFIYPLNGQAQAQSSEPEDPFRVAPHRSGARVAAVISAVFLAATLIVPAWLVIAHTGGAQPNFSLSLATSLPGLAYSPAFSPDGNLLAFLYLPPGAAYPDLYVQVVGEQKPLRLTTTSAGPPAWMPDGRALVFPALSSEGFVLNRVSALGGAPTRIVPIRVDVHHATFIHPTVSPDGRYVYYPERSEAGPYAIVRYNFASGDKSVITAPPNGSVGDMYPTLSPDGTRLAFTRHGSETGADVFITSPGGGTPTRITEDNRLIAGLDWAPDGRSIVFAGDRDGALRLWRVAAGGGSAPELLPFPSDGAIVPAISPHGQLAFVQGAPEVRELWEVPLAGGTPRALTPSSRTDRMPDYSPDGHEIVFASDRTGKFQIWKLSEKSSEGTLLAARISEADAPRWSPQGGQIAFQARYGKHFAIFLMDSDGADLKPLTDGSADDVLPTWSPDGRWLYFSSNRTGRWEVFRLPAGGGEATPMTKTGGYFGQQLGEYLYYVVSDTNDDIWRIPLSGGPRRLVLHRPAQNSPFSWRASEKGILLVEIDPNTLPAVLLLDPDTGLSERLAAIDRPASQAVGLALAPDRHTVLVSLLARNQGDVVLVSDFR